jgi:post-GPI attachment to proteins factor 3
VVEQYYLQLFWTCQDDCAYDCMWHTVSAFQKQGWGVPQFFGRVNFHSRASPPDNKFNFLFQWPFVRVLGLQEPASVVFSLFNLVANLKMLNHFQSKVHKSVPCYYLWTTHSWVNKFELISTDKLLKPVVCFIAGEHQRLVLVLCVPLT